MESRTVYSAEPRWAQQALVVLRTAGVAAEILDSRTEAVRQKSAFTPVHVVVPEAEVARAREVLQQWEADSERAAAGLGRSVGLALVTVFGPPLVA